MRRLRTLRLLPLAALLAIPAAGTAAAQARHPLDPLTAEEIAAAAGVLKASPGFPRDALFSTIVLAEPEKAEVLGHRPGAPVGRRAFSVVLDRRGNRTFEATVDLGAGRVLSWNRVEGAQPAVLTGEYEALQSIVKADAGWRAAMRRRGIRDFEKVQIDGWAVGEVPEARRGARLLRALSYLKDGQVNFYGRPIEGVVALVDMNTERVLEVEDTGVVPIAPAS
ncbi:MAG TPA: hypothetical protein VF263_03375, partial [Longimicrobiaceae bacterium]